MEDEAQQKEERRARERRAAETHAAVRMAWRTWARAALVPPEPAPGKGTETLRIAIRLPRSDSAPRTIRHFLPADTLTALFAYVDAQFIPASSPASSSSSFKKVQDPLTPPENTPASDASLAHQPGWWGFRLYLAYPRRELVWRAGAPLGGVPELRGGAQIVVEPVEPAGGVDGDRDGAEEDEEDGYDTESD